MARDDRIRICDGIPNDWDVGIERAGVTSGFGQSTAFARIMERAWGAQTFVIELSGLDRGDPVGALAVHDAERNGGIAVREGPILDPGQPDVAVQVGSIARALMREVRRRGASYAEFRTWPVGLLRDLKFHDTIAPVLEGLGWRSSLWMTSLVDLGPPEEQIFEKLHRSARKGVRRCEDAGVRIRVCADFDETYDLFYDGYCAAMGRSPRPRDHKRQLWTLGQDRYYRHLVALGADNRPLGYLGIILFNGVATEIASAVTDHARRQSIPAQDLIHWTAFQLAKQAGCRWFNLAGFAPEPSNPKEVGIRRFKEKWGGLPVTYPIWTFVPFTQRLRRGARGVLRQLRNVSAAARTGRTAAASETR